jgi:hypothetical protein
MTYVNPFKQPGNWYRGNTHSHSTESDGKLPMGERFAGYRDAGYNFLVLTDHRKVNDVSGFSSDGFLAISGSEVHPSNPYGGDTYHIVAINIHERLDCAHMHPNEVIAEIRRQGGEAVLCHPYWCGHTILDYLPLHGYFAVEVYNDTCMEIGKGYAESTWDELLDKAGPVLGIAADDAHRTDDCYHGWLMVKAPELTITAIMDALRSGAFYATQGPEIQELTVEEIQATDREGNPLPTNRISIRCSPARSIVFKGQRSRGTRILAKEGEALTDANYIAPTSAKYVRVEVTDVNGKKAWSNPVFM